MFYWENPFGKFDGVETVNEVISNFTYADDLIVFTKFEELKIMLLNVSIVGKIINHVINYYGNLVTG